MLFAKFPHRSHFQDTGISNGISLSVIEGNDFSLFIYELQVEYDGEDYEIEVRYAK